MHIRKQHVMGNGKQGAVAQWREHLSSINLAWVQIEVSTALCGLNLLLLTSPLLWEIFLWLLFFSPLLKHHHFHVVPNSNLTSWNSRQRTWLRGYATSEKIIIYYVWEHKAIRLCYWVICWPDDQVQKLWHGYGCFGNHNHLWTNLGCNLYFNQTFIMVSMKQNFGSILHFCSSLRPNIFLTPRF